MATRDGDSVQLAVNMADNQGESWHHKNFRQSVRTKIDEAIRQAGNPTQKTVAEMETHVFQKARSKEEYLSLVARILIHIKDRAMNQESARRSQLWQALMPPNDVVQPTPEVSQQLDEFERVRVAYLRAQGAFGQTQQELTRQIEEFQQVQRQYAQSQNTYRLLQVQPERKEIQFNRQGELPRELEEFSQVQAPSSVRRLPPPYPTPLASISQEYPAAPPVGLFSALSLAHSAAGNSVQELPPPYTTALASRPQPEVVRPRSDPPQDQFRDITPFSNSSATPPEVPTRSLSDLGSQIREMIAGGPSTSWSAVHARAEPSSQPRPSLAAPRPPDQVRENTPFRVRAESSRPRLMEHWVRDYSSNEGRFRLLEPGRSTDALDVTIDDYVMSEAPVDISQARADAVPTRASSTAAPQDETSGARDVRVDIPRLLLTDVLSQMRARADELPAVASATAALQEETSRAREAQAEIPRSLLSQIRARSDGIPTIVEHLPESSWTAVVRPRADLDQATRELASDLAFINDVLVANQVPTRADRGANNIPVIGGMDGPGDSQIDFSRSFDDVVLRLGSVTAPTRVRLLMRRAARRREMRSQLYERRPTANTPKIGLVEENDVETTQSPCVVCAENERRYLFLTCGHFCTCGTCTNKITRGVAGRVLCPICREPPTGVQRVYVN